MLNVQLDSSQLTRLAERAALLTEKNLRYAVAAAMTDSGRKAQANLLDQAPRFIDNPTSWTKGGIFQRPFAKPSDLTITLGFATERRGRGSPAGRYVNPMAAGTTPHLKGADLSASRLAGVSRRSVLIPAATSGLIDSFGNVPLRRQADILGKARDGGSSGVFIAPVRRGSRTMAIFQRKQGFIPRSSTLESSVQRLFTIDESPKPRARQFPVQQIVNDSFASAWRRSMSDALDAEISRTLGRR
jgi:hypothetical protein